MFEDAGISASSFSRKPRPAYTRLCEGLADGTYRGVIAYSAERLYRRLGDLEALIDLIEETGAEVHIVNAAGRIDLTTPPGRFSARAVAMAHALTEEMRAERIRLQRRQYAESGGARHLAETTRAYGYGCDGVTIDEAEAATVRWMFEKAALGWTLGRIGREAPTRRGEPRTGGRVGEDDPHQPAVHRQACVQGGSRGRRAMAGTGRRGDVRRRAGCDRRATPGVDERPQPGRDAPVGHPVRRARLADGGPRRGRKAIYATNDTARRAGSHRIVSVYRHLLDDYVIAEARTHVADLAAVDVAAPPSPEQTAIDAIVAELAVLDEMVDAGELTAVEYRRRRTPKLAAWEEAKAAAPPPKRKLRAKDLQVFKRWDDLSWEARRDAIHRIVARVTVAAVAPGKKRPSAGQQPGEDRLDPLTRSRTRRGPPPVGRGVAPGAPP